MSMTKRVFAAQLKTGLLKHYHGAMPSFNVIARDFTLHAPDLSPVSSETIRNWLRGESMPHISRMQVLIEWLGADLVEFAIKPSMDCCNKGFRKTCQNDRLALCDLIEKLDQQESQAMMAVLHMLASRHNAKKL